MARIIALDWDTRQLRIVVANHQSSQTIIEEVHSIPIHSSDGGSDGTDVEGQVSHIAELLDGAVQSTDLRARGSEIRVAVRRFDVELRLIQLPAVPVDELPTMVRFQALREFSELSEDWPLDYLPLRSDDVGVSVLAAAISPARLRRYQDVLERIGLAPSVTALRPTATATTVRELDPNSRTIAEVCVEDLGHACEMSILREGVPVLIRTVQTPQIESSNRARFLGAEIRRTMLAARDQLQDEKIEQMVMFGSSQCERELGAQLEDQLGLSVRLLDPFDIVRTSSNLDLSRIENPGQFAAAVGMLTTCQEDETKLIDFLNPRQPPSPKSSRHQIVAGVTAVLLSVVIGAALFYWHLSDMDRQVAELQREVQSQRDMVTIAEQQIANLSEVQDWQQSHVNWLELFGNVSAQLPGPDQSRLDRIQADVLASGDGQLILEGIVDSQATIAVIDDALRGDNIRVFSDGGQFENRVKDLPWRFKDTVTIETEAGKRSRTKTRRSR